MGEALERILGDRVKNGVLVTDRKHRADVKSKIVVGGHPVPTQGSLDAAKLLIDLVMSADHRSLIIFLISGGGSALVELPRHPEVTLEDLQEMNRILIGCGANIWEINTIRKHLSGIKGGKLGLRAAGARGIAFYVSDVNPGDLRSIASNPVLPEALSEDDFLGVISRYSLIDKLPPTFSGAIKRGSATDDDRRDRMPVEPLLVLDNSAALEAAASVSRELGFKTVVHENLTEGSYKKIAVELLERLAQVQRSSSGKPVCLISGGEASCPVFGRGIGGRNQEFVLYSAATLAQSSITQPTAILSCGTDGIDGNSPAAGAVADERTIADARARGLNAQEYLSRNDSHSFFKSAGGVVFTGPTGNNVRDVRVLVSYPN